MKYQMFITTCLKSQVNGLNRILIDIHEENPDYLGDGVFASQASSFMYPKTPFQEAVKRYGTDAFVKSILLESNYYEEVNDKFKEFVTHSLVKLSHIYNWNVNQTYPILYQFDQNGNFIKQWDCIKDAMDELNICRSSIHRCCTGKFKQSHGFIWRYAD